MSILTYEIDNFNETIKNTIQNKNYIRLQLNKKKKYLHFPYIFFSLNQIHK